MKLYSIFFCLVIFFGLSVNQVYASHENGGCGNSHADRGPDPHLLCRVDGVIVLCCTISNTCPITFYSQSSYYTQGAYEDTPTIDPPTTTNPSVSLYIQKQGVSGWSKNLTVGPSDEVSLRWVVARATSCRATGATPYYTISDTSGISGSTNTVTEPTTGLRVYRIECRNAAGTIARSSASLTVSATPLTLTATPKLIRTNETSNLNWNVGGRTGCIVAQKINNADSTIITTDQGTRDTITLTGETTYRLSCPDGSQTEATIKVLPIYSET